MILAEEILCELWYTRLRRHLDLKDGQVGKYFINKTLEKLGYTGFSSVFLLNY